MQRFMSYTKRIVCLANSFKTGGLCIAGREVTDAGYGGWVRPVSSRPHEELTYLEYRYADGSSPRLLDVVEVTLQMPMPHKHQSENHLIEAKRGWVKRGEVPFEELPALLEHPESLWTDSDHTASGLMNCVSHEEAAQYTSSLYLVEVQNFAIWVTPGQRGNRAFYGVFLLNGHLYKLSVTDPQVRERYDTHAMGKYRVQGRRDTILCVSLTKPYEGDGRCHKLIASVFTQPPL